MDIRLNFSGYVPSVSNMYKNLNRLIFIFSILGLVISAFLTYEYLQANPVVCPLTGNGCELVRKSAYSHFLGISIPYLGIAYYLVTAALSVYLTQSFKKNIDWFRFLFAILSVLFGIYLTYIEAFKIQAFCFWCVSSFITSIIILVLASLSILIKNSETSNEN